MKSKAHIRGHPIHPILVGFPIAFFIGTLLFDLLGIIRENPVFLQTGKYLTIAGIISALAAAVPGSIDYFFTVPPKSSAKKRAAKHGLLNIGIVIIFLAALLIRTTDGSFSLVLLLETAGAAGLLFSGWMGGTLVYRNQIGVNPRYAHAGKWKEEYFDQKSGEIVIARNTELEINQMKLLHFKDKRLVLGRTETGYAVFDDHCTHRGGSLAGGAMICGTVQCPWHGSQFDVQTGMVKAGPAKEHINTYPVAERDGNIYLTIIAPRSPLEND